MARRLVAIMNGSDWADASVTFLALPEGSLVDLETVKQEWERSRNPGGKNKPFRHFPQFLVEEYGAELQPAEIEEFWYM